MATDSHMERKVPIKFNWFPNLFKKMQSHFNYPPVTMLYILLQLSD